MRLSLSLSLPLPVLINLPLHERHSHAALQRSTVHIKISLLSPSPALLSPSDVPLRDPLHVHVTSA